MTSQVFQPRIYGSIPGRALYICKDGDLYIARKYLIYRSADWGATWQLACYVPSPGWEFAASQVRLGARLLRHYIAAFQVLADGSRIAVAHDGLYRAEAGEVRMHRVFRITRGSRPLGFAADGPQVLFGEYGDDFRSKEVFIYISQDYGRTFEAGFHFPKGDIRHVHNVIVDPYRDGYWVLAGDYGRDPGVGFLSKDAQTFEWLNRGTQRLRIVSALVEPDCLLCGTDSNCERNFIVRIDKNSGRVDDLAEIEGSSLYAARFGPVRVISTCVEPNPACPSRECSLYASEDGEKWNRFAVHRSDKWSRRYFQYATLVLPYACHGQPRGVFSGVAVLGQDGKFSFVDFDPNEHGRPTNYPVSASMPLSRPPRVFIVSSLPPPLGGVATHTERLCRLLHAHGYRIDVFEQHTKWLDTTRFPFPYHHGWAAWTMVRFALSCFVVRPPLIHIHLSAARRVFPIVVIIALLSRFFKIIVSVHSGSFTKRVSEASRRERKWLDRAFQSVEAIVAVSPENKNTLVHQCGVDESKVTVIPAYLSPPAPVELSPLGAAAQKRILLATGSGTPIYFWEGLLEAVQGLALCDELVLAFYGEKDHPYYDDIIARAGRLHPMRVTIHHDLSPEEFQGELSRATLFVRPTLTDGDSLAVREALSLRKQVVASDAVARPSGCMLFQNRNVDDLREKLVLGAEMPPAKAAPDRADFSKPLLELYQRLLSAPAR